MLSSVEAVTTTSPDIDPSQYTQTDIKFAFEAPQEEVYTLAQVQQTFDNLVEAYENGGNLFENILTPFEELVHQFREVPLETLSTMADDLFDCPSPCVDPKKVLKTVMKEVLPYLSWLVVNSHS